MLKCVKDLRMLRGKQAQKKPLEEGAAPVIPELITVDLS